jgi:uncharacterized RDD family membrane protein YckC
MKCPKCAYLGFESSDRCRNCGYEFSLAPLAAAPLDLEFQSGSDPLISSPDAQTRRPPLDLDRMIGGPPEDLPLFGGGPDDSAPLITAPSRPRAPLGVRRATLEVPRARISTPRPHEETLFGAAPPSGLGFRPEAHRTTVDALASPTSRIVAALVDGALLFGLDAAVLYFTLRLCNLTASEILQLPLIPLMAFFLLLNGGYFVAFTAVGGQSIGKMALGIKVVGQGDAPVALSRAALRTLGYVASALPLGAGFLPGVFGADRLALHDRLAHTRVVRPASI